VLASALTTGDVMSVVCGEQVILIFKCRIPASSNDRCGTVKDLAFVEELWEFKPARRAEDHIVTEFGCKRLYRTSPVPTYYVLDLWRIIGMTLSLHAHCTQ